MSAGRTLKENFKGKFYLLIQIKLDTAHTQFKMKYGSKSPAVTGSRIAKVAWLNDRTDKSLSNLVALIGSLTGLDSKFAV
jgi:hypothetical protein